MEIGTRSIKVEDESRVAEVRRVAAGFGKAIGFDAADIGRVSLVATELTTNLLKHASRGEVLASVCDDGVGAGVQVVALDRGPGFSDLPAALRDGHSTAGSPGTGLGAIGRQADVFEIFAPARGGTAILTQLYRRSGGKPLSPVMPFTGGVGVAKDGEQASGDAWSVQTQPNGDLCVMVADGLGHGPLAAAASHAAVMTFRASDGEPTADLMQKMHAALRPTRGAAASVAKLSADSRSVTYIGVGNVAGAVISDAEVRRMVGYNGTLGHALKGVKPFEYPTQGDILVVLASDGLGTSWSLNDYPGLQRRHPALIAAVLYRDFNRGRDDVTVLVARISAK